MNRRPWSPLAICLVLSAAACSGSDPTESDDRICSLAVGAALGSESEACIAVANGRAIFDGDIDLGDAEDFLASLEAGAGTLGPQAISPSRESAFKLWPSGAVHYTISASFPVKDRQTIEAAIAHFNSFQSVTGVRWIKRSTYSNVTSYVYIRPDPDPASVTHGSSAIGRASGVQYLNLNFPNMVLHGKNPIGTVLHEMGHASGLCHEQSREDRDQYITIHPENVDPQYAGQFDKLTGPLWDDIGPYDFASVMHYAWDNGSKKYDVLPTITKKDGSLYTSGTELGVLSAGDLEAIEYLYRSVVSVTLPFSDDFSRPDDIILGPAWQNRTGKIDLENGKAANAAPSYWSIEQLGKGSYGSSLIELEADLEVGEYGAYLVARYKGPGNTNHYYAGISRSGANGSPRVTIRKNVGGVYYELGGVDVTQTSGHFRFEVEGKTLRLYLNNQLKVTATDTSFYSGGVGIKLAGSARLDNFSASK